MSGGVTEARAGVRAWPANAAAPVAHQEQPAAHVQDYHDLTVDSVASRAASSISEWGDGAAEKTAASKVSLWKDPDAHPVALILMLLDRYGPEYLEWDPEVLRVTLSRDASQISNTTWTKILAGRVVLNSPSPWRQWDVFAPVSRGLAGIQPNFVYLEEPDIGYLMAAVDTMKLIDPKRPTGIEVDKFVAAALKHDGNVMAPAPLDFATRELENPQLSCGKCGALHRDDNDQKCICCGSSALKKVPFEFEDLKAQCLKLWTPRIKMPLERAVDGLPQDAAGNLVYHLLVHWDYARRMRQLLLTQLRAL